jgi:hypothetical protein
MRSRKFPKACLFGVLAAVLFAGCSMPTVVRRGEPFELDKPAVVMTQYGGEFRARSLYVQNDSVVITRERGADIKISLDKVKTIAEFDRFGGFARGAGNGLLAGAGIGLVIGALVDADCSGECGSPPGIMVGPIVGAIWTAPLGAFLGAMKGHGQSYRFDTTGAGSRRMAARQARDSIAAEQRAALAQQAVPNPMSEEVRYPSHLERSRKVSAPRRPRVVEVTQYYYGAEVGTPGLFHLFNSPNTFESFDANILPFDGGYLSVSFGKVFSPTSTGGLRLAGMRGSTEDTRLREIALMVEGTQALGSRGSFVKGGLGLANYEATHNDATWSDGGLAASLGIGQEMFKTTSLTATLSLEAWAASYGNDSRSATLKILAGLNWK